MAEQQYQPVHHSAASRAGHALGQGAQKSFFGGIRWGALTAITYPFITAGIAGLIGAAAFAAPVALVAATGWAAAATIGSAALIGGGIAASIGAIAGILSWPAAIAAGTGFGMIKNFFEGGRQGADMVRGEMRSMEYQQAYNQTMQQHNMQLAQVMEAQAMAAYQPMPQPVVIPQEQHANIEATLTKAVANENEPTNKIAASTAERSIERLAEQQ